MADAGNELRLLLWIDLHEVRVENAFGLETLTLLIQLGLRDVVVPQREEGVKP